MCDEIMLIASHSCSGICLPLLIHRIATVLVSVILVLYYDWFICESLQALLEEVMYQ